MYAQNEDLRELMKPDRESNDPISSQEMEIIPEEESYIEENDKLVLVNQSALTNNFQAKTEEDLINYTRHLYSKLAMSMMMTYYYIGKGINDFYEKKYGKNEIERISDKTSIQTGTLQKACKFAREYSEDQVTELLNGRFTIAWNHISQNLTVKPENLIGVYKESESAGEFNNGIIKFKSSNENRGKARKVENEDIISQTESSQDVIDVTQSHAEIIDDDMVLTDSHETEITEDAETIESLIEKTDELKKALDLKDGQLQSQNNIINEMNRDIEEKDTIIFTLKEGLKKIPEMIKNGATGFDIIKAITKIQQGIS